MSAMPARKLRQPEELYSPSFPPELVENIAVALTEEGGREFFRQVHEASEKAREEGDLRYLNDVFESWYRTLLFERKPDFEENWKRAQAVDGPRLTAADIRERHGRGRPAS